MDKPPEEPGNVIRWPLSELHIDDLTVRDFEAFAQLAEAQGKSVEGLLGEAVRLMLAKHRQPKGPAEIVRPSFHKPQEPQP